MLVKEICITLISLSTINNSNSSSFELIFKKIYLPCLHLASVLVQYILWLQHIRLDGSVCNKKLANWVCFCLRQLEWWLLSAVIGMLKMLCCRYCCPIPRITCSTKPQVLIYVVHSVCHENIRSEQWGQTKPSYSNNSRMLFPQGCW